MGKRLDLQCLRGVAIFEVLLFHFWPSKFQNGYIGVDLFFVLSGYLISMILHRSRLPLPEVFKSFYYSRVKRIFPAYLLFIFLTLISLFFIFPETNIDINIKCAFPALFFYTNMLTADGVSRYEALLAVGDNLFTHTWSLAVEIQFYLLVPIIYLSGRYLGIPKSALLISALSGVSLLFYLISDENTSFNYVFARLWQFLAGYIVFLKTHVDRIASVAQKTETKDVSIEGIPKKDLSVKEVSVTKRLLIEGSLLMILATILVLGFAPDWKFHKDMLRGITTVLAALFIYLGGKSRNPIFSFRPLCYLGDISYILYLVHYPIHVYLNLHSYKTNQAKFNGFALSIFTAIVVHELFERFYLKLKKKPILALVSFLYAGAILVVVFSPQISVAVSGPKLDFHEVLRHRDLYGIDDLVKINTQFNIQDLPFLKHKECTYDDGHGPFGICRTAGNPRKSHTALVVGNSYAPNTFRKFYDKCNKFFKNITMESYAGCEVLWDSIEFGPKYSCEGIQEKFIKDIQTIAPDYLFIISRHIHLHAPHKAPQKELDARTEKIKKTVMGFEAIVKKKIFILTASLLPPNYIVGMTNTAMKKTNSTHNLFPHGLATNPTKIEETKNVIRNATSECTKCELMDVTPYFLDKKNKFHFYDENNGLLYFTNSMHFSGYGLYKIEPMFEDFCTNHL